MAYQRPHSGVRGFQRSSQLAGNCNLPSRGLGRLRNRVCPAVQWPAPKHTGACSMMRTLRRRRNKSWTTSSRCIYVHSPHEHRAKQLQEACKADCNIVLRRRALVGTSETAATGSAVLLPYNGNVVSGGLFPGATAFIRKRTASRA